ncbi:MAG TPA: GNAT family N-acetyltransferase [Microvirga sp.]|nr:GNAT family N-acetyltransferase [Microvirga sp.]
MSDPALVLALESRLINAWPSFDYQVYDGWLLRLAKGYSKRANSASPLIPGARLDDALVDHMVAHFLAENVRPTFRLTSLEAPDAGALLERRGFRSVESTRVITKRIPDDCTVDPSVILEPKVSMRWVRETAQSYGGEKADDAILVEIVSRIRQTAVFATLDMDDVHVAWGLGVVERGFVGLYDVVVAPDLRGIGLGRRLVTSLMAWGRDSGAHTAYLQVREDNEVARGLYTEIGFEPAYRYTHRVMPGRSSS